MLAGNFVGRKALAKPANRIVGWMVEIDDIVDISPDFGGKEFGIEGRLFRPRIAVQPGVIGEGKRLRGSLLGGLCGRRQQGLAFRGRDRYWGSNRSNRSRSFCS